MANPFRRPAPSRGGRGSVRGGVPVVPATTIDTSEIGDWYSNVLLGASALGALATSAEVLSVALKTMETLQQDDYTRFLSEFYRAGSECMDERWGYADISTALVAAARVVQPRSYLEIGVRRGRSMAMVASECPGCAMVGFDMWIADYAGIENPGPDFVRSELRSIGHTGEADFIDGNSHETVPAYFGEHPDVFFDMITVDGDHTLKGARQDLMDVIPRLCIGGVLVFDDIRHPAHPGLRDVWDDVVASDDRFSSWTYDDIGYGVAIAVRRA